MFCCRFVVLLSFVSTCFCKRMPKTRTSRGSVRARGRGCCGSRRRSTSSSVTCGAVLGRLDTSVSDSSVAPRLGSPATNPPSGGDTSLPNLLQMIREEVREQLAMQATDRQPGAGRFVTAVSSPPFRRAYTSLPAISSRVHFVTSHFVVGTLRRLPFCREDISSPAVSSRGHFVAGARREFT